MMKAIIALCILVISASLLGCSDQSEEIANQPTAEQTAHIEEQEITPNLTDDDSIEKSEAEDVAPSPDLSAETNASPDGFPTGQQTPEGAACDLARSFINADAELFKSVCLSWKAGESGEQYTAFIEDMAARMNSMQGQSLEQFGGPKEITTCYEARHLSNNGPGSYGFAVMNLMDVMFVDVIADTWEGSPFMSRTLVVMRSDQNWYAVPRTDLFPLLSTGLMSESDSTAEWNDE